MRIEGEASHTLAYQLRRGTRGKDPRGLRGRETQASDHPGSYKQINYIQETLLTSIYREGCHSHTPDLGHQT